MHRIPAILFVLATLLLVPLPGKTGTQTGPPCTVLVIMSYHEQYYWSKSLRAGIEETLQGECGPVFFYLDTKRNIKGARQRAILAHRLYRKMAPSGVIAADDNAQPLFVLPYLKDRVKTPVVFCGVNAAAEEYGYPAANVTGVLERPHIAETIALGRQLDPSIRRIAFMVPDNRTGKNMLTQARTLSSEIGLPSPLFLTISTWEQMENELAGLADRVDAVYLLSMEGVRDVRKNMAIPLEELMQRAAAVYPDHPILTDSAAGVRNGGLCTVQQSGYEQGMLCAKMLLEILQGTPIAFVPISRNRNGKRYINVTALKRLQLSPAPSALRGTTLVTTRGTGTNHRPR
ncbi:ABC transporter substrate-binding protein [Desulfoplanes sp.]